MAGEVSCQWAPWFRTHYTDFDKAPPNFQLAVWTAEHNQLLNELEKERRGLQEGTFRESQNQFRVRRPSGMAISGRPDLITIDQNGLVKIYDVKTGTPRHSDVIQVMLYMILLPFFSPLYKGKQPGGCVVYKNGNRSEIPAKAIDADFQGLVTHFLNIVESPEPPGRTPGAMECQYCDITDEDCEERSNQSDSTEGNEPQVPL